MHDMAGMVNSHKYGGSGGARGIYPRAFRSYSAAGNLDQLRGHERRIGRAGPFEENGKSAGFGGSHESLRLLSDIGQSFYVQANTLEEVPGAAVQLIAGVEMLVCACQQAG